MEQKFGWRKKKFRSADGKDREGDNRDMNKNVPNVAFIDLRWSGNWCPCDKMHEDFIVEQ